MARNPVVKRSKPVAVYGGDEIRKLLTGLPLNVAKKALRTGIRNGAKIIAEEAKRLAPVDTGRVRDSIKVRAATKLRRKTAVGVRIIAGDGWFTGEAFYGYFWEYGFFKQPVIRMENGQLVSMKRGRGDPTWVPARPFMRPALEIKQTQATDAVTRAVRSYVLSLNINQ